MTNGRYVDSGLFMSRPWRIEYEGALYHLLSRGNERSDIFISDKDRSSFLDAVGEMSERFAIDVFAYVMIPTCCSFLTISIATR